MDIFNEKSILLGVWIWPQQGAVKIVMRVLCFNKATLVLLRHVCARALSFSASKMANESTAQKMGDSLPPFPHFGTLAIHAGQEPEQWHSRAVVPPISMATTFKQDAPGVHRVSKTGWFNLLPFAIMQSFRAMDSHGVWFSCVFFRDLNIHVLGIQQETALKRVSLLWRVRNMVSFHVVISLCHV